VSRNDTGGSGHERNGRFAVLFDMDGVLLEGRGTDPAVHARALDDLLDARGMAVAEEHRATLSTYEYTDAFVNACTAVGVDPEAFYTEREEHSAARTVERAASRGLFDDVGALDRLPDRVAVGLVSNNYHRTVEFVVERFGLTAFDTVRGRELGPVGFSRRKPEPYYLVETLDALGATDGIYVGDRETDIVAAGRAGLDSAFLRREHNANVELGVEPTVEIDGLDEVIDVIGK
jgi:phosphoglycolate phosphatase-like HAD superfamily hydrolase